MTKLALHRAQHFSSPAGKLGYLIYEPPGWSEEARPLVLFLHGVGERGNDLERVAAHGIPYEIERGKNFPFVAVSPQCPAARTWSELTPALEALLDELVPKLNIDPRRIYLAGLSMGAFGAWKLAAANPDRCAALVSVCGGGDDGLAPKLRDLPVWAFHGELDTVVSVRHTRDMAEALKALGAPLKVTIYPELGHECWAEAFATPELYEWLLAQRRSDAQQAGHAVAEHGARVC